mmetsp:Transcript_24933/g.50088  ORF Transcript_24933/g.50088 Transcript_24933/m.50088 type:complete len:219 (+) Transcript_24933:956-1612(+)
MVIGVQLRYLIMPHSARHSAYSVTSIPDSELQHAWKAAVASSHVRSQRASPPVGRGTMTPRMSAALESCCRKTRSDMVSPYGTTSRKNETNAFSCTLSTAVVATSALRASMVGLISSSRTVRERCLLIRSSSASGTATLAPSAVARLWARWTSSEKNSDSSRSVSTLGEALLTSSKSCRSFELEKLLVAMPQSSARSISSLCCIVVAAKEEDASPAYA